VFKFCEILQTGNRRNRALLTRQNNKISSGFQSVVLCRSYPNTARANPQQCTQSAPDLIQIGSLYGAVIAERMNSAKLPSRVNPLFARSIALRQIKTKN